VCGFDGPGADSSFESSTRQVTFNRHALLAHANPTSAYHISTLLQVSEIAKQQRDYATAGDMLERALFAFGRASNSTFISHLAEGKARLDFRRPENREFWLAGWRYIATLGIRATWRTAFEWAKLLLSLAPEEDPYCLRLSIDQLALRGREPQSLINLVDSDHLQRAWKIPPNLAFSVALAHDRLKNPEKARSALQLAIKEYPWIAARLCKELEISPIPKSVWGKEPVLDYHEILCQLYVPKAKDLWNTPEATALLVEVLYSIEEPLGAGEAPYWLARVDELSLARHIILLDDKPLLSLLDNKVKSKFTSVSDPLPPEDSISSYSLSDLAAAQRPALDETQLLTDLERMRIYFSNIELGGNINENTTQEDIIQMLREAGTSMDEFRRNTERVQVLRAQLRRLGLQVIFDGEAAAATEEREERDNQDTASDSDA
jgi:tetratricopeptide (TPR) repeat protein